MPITPKVVGGDDVQPEERRRLARRRHVAFDLERPLRHRRRRAAGCSRAPRRDVRSRSRRADSARDRTSRQRAGSPQTDCAGRDAGRDYLRGLKPRVDARQRPQAADQQPRAGHEQHREGNLPRSRAPCEDRQRRRGRRRGRPIRAPGSGWPRRACRTGARPNAQPVTIASVPANARTRQFIWTSARRGVSTGSTSLRMARACPASSSPRPAPSEAQQHALGQQLPRDASPAPAPSAARRLISRSRAAARESDRFATFAHAITSTSATAPSRIGSRVCTGDTSARLQRDHRDVLVPVGRHLPREERPRRRTGTGGSRRAPAPASRPAAGGRSAA